MSIVEVVPHLPLSFRKYRRTLVPHLLRAVVPVRSWTLSDIENWTWRLGDVAPGPDRGSLSIDHSVLHLGGTARRVYDNGNSTNRPSPVFLTKSMLEHSRGGTGERREVDLIGLVEEALNLVYHGARAQDQSFNTTLERDLDHALAPIELVPPAIQGELSDGFRSDRRAAAAARHCRAAARRPL